MSAGTQMLRLPPLAKISDLLRVYGLRAKKQLSQNFILDLNVTNKLAHLADVFDCHVVEVGAGPGSFSRSLLNAGVRHLHAVEIDERFEPSLQILQDAAKGRMTLHRGDIMEFDFSDAIRSVIKKDWTDPELPNLRLVGNLPFNVSIPLLFQWLEALNDRQGPFVCGRVPMSLVFQREVAENVLAPVRSSIRTKMSVISQYCCEVTKGMTLPSTVFTPQPKVDAIQLNFVPLKKPLIDAPFDVVAQVVRAVFIHKRKYVRDPLRYLFPSETDQAQQLADELLSRAQVEPTLRSHQLKMADFDALCREFMNMCDKYGLNLKPMHIAKPISVQELREMDVSSQGTQFL